MSKVTVADVERMLDANQLVGLSACLHKFLIDVLISTRRASASGAKRMWRLCR